jgi:RimJ/RimL family protein N-acetyltransferase
MNDMSAELDEVLGGGRRIVVRPVEAGDVDALTALYDSLDPEDHYRRFFSAYRPRRQFFEEMTTVAERGGARLVAIVTEADGSERLVAEAGYTLLPDGDGELAIAVERSWRGWLGPYLLDAVAGIAAEAGVPNLEAEVLVVNRPMIAMLRSRGAMSMQQGDWSVLRLLIGSGERQPTWPGPHDRRRVLIEGPSGCWRLDHGDRPDVQMITCSGPHRGIHDCPALNGGRCLLAATADEIVVTHPLDDDQWRALVRAHGKVHPGVPVRLQPPS